MRIYQTLSLMTENFYVYFNGNTYLNIIYFNPKIYDKLYDDEKL